MHLNIKHIVKIAFITSIFFVEFETKGNLNPLSKIYPGCPQRCLTSIDFIYAAYPTALWAFICCLLLYLPLFLLLYYLFTLFSLLFLTLLD